MDAWIEIPRFSLLKNKKAVASFMDAWIEILCSRATVLNSQFGRILYGCVD